MKDEEIKSLWKTTEPASKTQEEIVLMLEESRHPVLKSIRMQMIIELIGWTMFLACYYSMFDGATKPLFINAILIVSVLIPLTHNLYGYKLAKNAVDSSNILMSLTQHLKRIKIYASRSIISRVVFTSGLLLFFSYNINFTTSKRYLAAVALILIITQIVILYQIWQKRIKSFADTLNEISRF